MFFPFLSEKKQSWRNPAYKEENHKNTLPPNLKKNMIWTNFYLYLKIYLHNYNFVLKYNLVNNY